MPGIVLRVLMLGEFIKFLLLDGFFRKVLRVHMVPGIYPPCAVHSVLWMVPWRERINELTWK